MIVETDQPPVHCEDLSWWNRMWSECDDDPDRGIIDEALRDAGELADAAGERAEELIEDLERGSSYVAGGIYNAAGELVDGAYIAAGAVYDGAGNLIDGAIDTAGNAIVDPVVGAVKFTAGAAAVAAVGITWILFGGR